MRPTPRIARSKRRIFVVDDHPAFCEGLVRLIKAEKDWLFCGKAGFGKEVFKVIWQHRPDLVLIDLGWSETRGLALIKQVRSLKPPVKVLVVSVQNEAIHAQRALRAGGDGYVLKQEGPSEIINAMRDVLNGHLYVSEEVLASGQAKSRSARQASPLYRLSDLELKILESLGEGNSSEEMARRFRMTAGEVNALCLQIQHTLGLKSLNALIRYAVCWVEGVVK
ncbi:MAG TPA: response regulator transcription factor [Candidatus Acidoferrales bacterium]|nr:response regulator transcription factor [Candidatus Acidoferrales bacterium]